MTPPTGVTDLRPLRKADGLAVQRLHARSFAALAAGSYPRTHVDAYVRTLLQPAYLDELLACHVVVAVGPAGAPVATAGWSVFGDAPATARIRKVFVDPAHARRGLATSLVIDAEARAAVADHDRFVLRANLNAIPLYLGLGYAEGEPDEMHATDGLRLPVRWMAKG